MMTIETLTIGAPLLVAAVVGLFALTTNYLDDRKMRLLRTESRSQSAARARMRTGGSPAEAPLDASQAENDEGRLSEQTLKQIRAEEEAFKRVFAEQEKLLRDLERQTNVLTEKSAFRES